MKSKQYLLIDKNIITEGVVFDFSIFLLSKSNNKIECFKEEGCIISSDDAIIVQSTNAIYIEDTKRITYNIFYKTYLSNLAKNKSTNLIDKSKNQNTIFTKRVEDLYLDASKVLNNLFKDPKSSNYINSQDIVVNLVNSVLNENFTIKSLMNIAANDYSTHTHSINVAIYSLSLGSFIGLKKETLAQLGEAALLHDLGKSEIDHAIISKNTKLTDKEFKQMQNHPLIGYKISIQLGIKNKTILNGIRHHHEKMDGSGYPYGLRKYEIPLFARIIGLCDIFDALTSKRSYKESMSTFTALKLMKIQMRDYLDPKLLNNMIMMFK